MLLSPFIKDYQRPKNVLQYYRFPWEKESPKDHKRVELTEENVSELYRIIGKLHKQTS